MPARCSLPVQPREKRRCGRDDSDITIAVLPLANLSKDADADYAGMADAYIAVERNIGAANKIDASPRAKDAAARLGDVPLQAVGDFSSQYIVEIEGLSDQRHAQARLDHGRSTEPHIRRVKVVAE